MGKTRRPTGPETAARAAQAANAGRRRRKRTGRRTLHYLLLLLFFGSVGLVLCLTVFFKIESIHVIGSDKYDPVVLEEASGVVKEDNLLRISKARITENLVNGSFPYIESVEVNRRIPSTVEIVITQSEPGGAVKEGDDYVLITKDGKVLERGTFYIPEHIPLIIGLDTAGVEPGEYLGAWTKTPKGEDETEEQTADRLALDKQKAERANAVKESMGMVENLFAAMEESGFGDITNVDISDRLNMKVVYDNRLVLELGIEADLTYKLEMVYDIIHNRLEDDARGIVRAGNARNKRIVVTPLDDNDELIVTAPLPEEEDGETAEPEAPTEAGGA
ncbi:FtsQ-type POTRA domain-containing protein [Ruminococcaceae bacterium OttesenSCG-928-L11]|nr:FtsQ-type POTRA domain-containing protein [Ruminococcaceae bacterium OttesenSCG-928-L11]